MTTNLEIVAPCPRCGAKLCRERRGYGRSHIVEVDTGAKHECPLPPTPAEVAKHAEAQRKADAMIAEIATAHGYPRKDGGG